MRMAAVPQNHSARRGLSSAVFIQRLMSLRISRKTLMRYRNAGELPYIILRNSAYYKENDVEKLITRFGSRLDKKAVEEFIANMNKSRNGESIANR